FLQLKLPDYMLPGVFVFVDSLPLTANGKLDYKALPAPGSGRPDLSSPFTPPSNPEQDLLASIWSQVLGVDRIGIHDNFFDLGGHSLLATQIIGRVRDLLGVQLPLRCMFEVPTIAGMVSTLQVARGQTGLSVPPIQPHREHKDPPLSFAQQQLWFLNLLVP